MSRYSWDDNYGFPEYVPVSEKKARNARSAAKLRKGDTEVQPVVVTGRKIASSWWGVSWNRNLERYADYSNRIARGRSYVRHGAVLDLRVGAGTVTALVQGSRSKPYQVTITIDPLPEPVWEQLRGEATKQLDTLADLLGGAFPKALKDTFFAQGTGLFPTPDEISFDCSCPDWASMCKHVAAVLYGIGNRLDASPELFFSLRQVTVDDLIAQTIDATTKRLVEKAETVTGDDVLADADLGDVFGIAIDPGDVGVVGLPPPETGKPPAAKPKQHRQKAKTPARKAKTKASNKAGTKTGGHRRAAARPRRTSGSGKPQSGTMVAQLLKALGRSGKPFRTADLLAKLPEWDRSQVTNTLYRAVETGRIERVERGIYRPV